MATINPVPVITETAPGVETFLWETLTESDTAIGLLTGGSKTLAGSFQVKGTWGGGTIVLQGSNIGPDDSDEWVTLKDINGDAIGLTADGGAEFSTAFKWIRPDDSVAGTSRDVDCYITLKG